MIQRTNVKVFIGRALSHHESNKLLLIAFFDVRGMVHCELLPQGQTVNQHVHKDIQERLFRSMREKRQDLGESNTWLLHHDNAPAHTALGFRKFLEKNITVLKQPPLYSTDLAPCDFFFPKLKALLKEQIF